MKNNKGIVGLVIIVIAIIFIGIGACSGGSSSSKSESARCPSCNKKFTNSEDVRSISYRGMCERCYSNYKYSQDLQDGLKKYEERYGLD